MHPETMSSLRMLPRGTCRCLEPAAQHRHSTHFFSKRGQGDEYKTSPAVDIPTALLVWESEKTNLCLCRWSCTGVALDTDRTLCFHSSIEVHPINQNEQDHSKRMLHEIVSRRKDDISAYAVTVGIEERSCCDTHSHVTIERRMRENDLLNYDFNCSAIFAMSSSPAPILSLTVQTTGPGLSSSPNSLEQASWKRQLVGSIILFREGKFTSTIALGDRDSKKTTVCIEALTARAPSSQMLFVVLPSTRISLVVTSTNYTAISLKRRQTSLGGTSPVAQQLLQTITCTYQHFPVPRTFLLSGPAGVGKTYSIKQVLESCPFPVKLVSLRGSEVLQSHSNAAQALAREFRTAAADDTKVSIIFLDECDALVSVDAVAATLATLLDKVATQWTSLLVVGATNRIDSLPAYLRRAGRFDKEIPLGPPNALERAAILLELLQEQLLGMSTDSLNHVKREIQHVAESCVGYVPADLNALVRRATLLAAQERESHSAATIHFLVAAMSDVGPSALRDASISAPPKIRWEDIAGDPGGAKTSLRQAIEWPRTKAASFAKLGLVPPRGILLHGPPGCAKTTLARAAAGASGVAFLSLSPAEVYASSYVGEAEAVVRRAFSLARSASPCVLFFDEIDSILGGSNDTGRGSSAEARVLSTFLNEMDGVDNNRGADGVLVLGATNRPWTLDSALLRPGRLGDKIIYIPPPDEPARRAILEMQFKEFPHDLDLNWLASDPITGNLTGAELVGACQEAKLRLLCDLTEQELSDHSICDTSRIQDYIMNVLNSMKPLLSDPVALQEFRLFEQLNSIP